MPRVIVKRSRVHGKGVFATRAFRRGEVVLRWDTNVRVTREEAARLPKREQHFLDPDGDGFILMQPPARYVNHSCAPNTKPRRNADVATRAIAAGEEITSDYACSTRVAFSCRCGSESCRRRIMPTSPADA